MRIFLGLLVLILPLALTILFAWLVYRKSETVVSKENVLRFPYLFRVVPILLLVFCFSLSLFILIFQFEDWPYIFLSLLFLGLPGLIMGITFILWKVEIKENGFVYRNFVGKKVEYDYGDLEYKEHPKGLKWYFYKGDKKVFCMPYYVPGGNRLYKVYRKRTNK